MVRAVGPQQRRPGRRRRSPGGSLRSRRTAGPGSVRFRYDVGNSVAGQSGLEKPRLRSHSARLDPGRDRVGHRQWTVDLSARRIGNRSRGRARSPGGGIRSVRGGIDESRRWIRSVQAGRRFPPRASHSRPGGERPLGRRVRALGGFPPGGAHAPGMVCSGRSRYGVPGELSRPPVPAKRRRYSLRSARTAVREAEPFTLGGADDSGPERRRPRRWPSLPTGGGVVFHPCGDLSHHGDRSKPAAHPDGM